MTYRAILTNTGAAKQASALGGGATVGLAQMAIGDGNGAEVEPVASQAALVNEVRRGPLSRVKAAGDRIMVEQVIPANIGGFWVREAGVIDESGDLIAVANLPERFKPLMIQGAGVTTIIRLTFVVGSGAAFAQVVVDPSTQLVTVDALADGLAGKSDADHQHGADDILDSSPVGRAVLTAGSPSSARAAIGAASEDDVIAMVIAIS